MSNERPNINELSLTASYYKLFRTRQPVAAAQGGTDTVVVDSTAAAAAAAANQNAATTSTASVEGGGFWEEDEWTPEDERQAERLLEKSRERCSIRSNGIARKDDAQAWNKFYSSHQTNFFKDRHYLQKAFPEEFSETVTTDQSTSNGNTKHQKNKTLRKRTLVEIGCGVGNALLPFLENDRERNNDSAADSAAAADDSVVAVEWTVHGLDLSKVAIDWLRQDERFVRAIESSRAQAYVCDISALPSASDSKNDPLTIPEGCRGVADVSTLLFCLSAIAPGPGMIQAVKNAAATLKSKTGVLVFRDYGRFDEAQLKLGTSRNKLLDNDNFYRKHDGTKCYYFSLEDVRDLFENHAGLKVLELKYLRRIYRNRGTTEVRRRVWVQGRFQQPQ